jgi:hypothetical protein
MTRSGFDLDRLRIANPQPTEDNRGRGAVAQATLSRILQESDEPARPSGRGWRRRRAPSRLVIVVATLLIGGGAAFAATDPLNWWSASRGQAMYRSNPAAHAQTPTEQQIRCVSARAGLRCSAKGVGQPYTRIDVIHPPAKGFTRAALLKYVARRLAAGAMTAAQAKRFRADLAAVPNSFFTEYAIATRYGTYATRGETPSGRYVLPPKGIPALLVCEKTTAGLSCQDLNGDEHVPIGGGVYAAQPGPDWRPAPAKSQSQSQLPPGISFTASEYRLLADMLRFATTTQISGVSTTG